MQLVSDVDVATEILSIIRHAKSYVVLVTPYVSVWERLVNEVRLAVARGVPVALYVRYETTGGIPASKQADNARALVAAGASLIAIRRLHTKVYLNEQTILTTSMNLVESSVLNSLELGIRWNHTDNPSLTSSILAYVHTLSTYAEALPTSNASQRVISSSSSSIPSDFVPSAKGAKTRATSEKSSRKKTQPVQEVEDVELADDEGLCLRCEDIIRYDPARPLCENCYAVWRRYGDPNYEENVCHACGEPHATSISRPLCYRCYRA